MFLTRHDVPRSFSVPPEPFQVRRPRRRGAISVTSSAAPSEMDRHMAQQLQQQVAIIRLKVAAELHTASDQNCCQEEDNGNVESSDAEIDRIRRELEAVQIDSALPSILGISAEFEQKLRLGSSSRSPDTSRHPGTLTFSVMQTPSKNNEGKWEPELVGAEGEPKRARILRKREREKEESCPPPLSVNWTRTMLVPSIKHNAK